MNEDDDRPELVRVKLKLESALDRNGELRHQTIVAEQRIAALDGEVRRLRELMERGQFGYDGFCPWCGGGEEQLEHTHAADCPAFTPDGTAK